MRSAMTTVLLSLLSVPVHAQVTFDEALDLGVRSPAGSRARRALAQREVGDADMGGTAQGTTVTLLPGAVVIPEEERGFDFQLNATQGWNLADLGGARRRAATREREALSARARAEALRARLEAGRRWLELRTLEILDTLLADQRAVAEQLAVTTRRAVDAGMATAADAANADALRAELAQRSLTIEGERFDVATQLALAMGGDDPRPRTAGPLPDPQLPDAATMRRMATPERMPSVAALRLAQVAARARALEAAARFGPVLQVGAQLEHTASDAWTLYGIAGLTFNGPHQDDRATSLAEAEAAETAADAELAEARARAELDAALHEVEHTRRRVAALEGQLLPSLLALRERRARALELGEGTRVALLEARRRELAAQAQLVRAQGERTWAAVRMWLLLAELERGEER